MLLSSLKSDCIQHYQPIVDLGSLVAKKHEALLRPARTGAFFMPEMIAELESNGRIPLLDAWSTFNALRKSEATGARICVNVSAVSICSRLFYTQVGRMLKSSPASSNICFELTEHSPISSISKASDFVTMAKGEGCAFGLDDYGDGYSGEAIVSALDFDFLKLPASLTTLSGMCGMTEDLMHHAIELAHGLGMFVVAEHIETIQQLDWLKDAGADFGQGWLFSPAVPCISVGKSYADIVAIERARVSSSLHAEIFDSM